LDPVTLGLVSLCVFAGGAVKGLAALGLPLVGIPLLTLVVGLKQAVALLVVPMIASNFVQSFQGGHFRLSLGRFRVLAPTAFVFALLGTRLLVVVPQRFLEFALGVALIVIPIVMHFSPRLALTPAHRRWGDPLVGIIAGLLGGTAAYYGPPLMLYVLGLRLPKDEFVSAIAMLYWIVGVALLIGVYAGGVAEPRLLAFSILMVVPTGVGMWLGQRVQFRMSEVAFARLLIAVYLATGLTFLIEAAA
jgi:uncharacterized protein